MHNSLTGRRSHRGGQHILLRRGGALRTLGAFILIAGSISLVLGIYLFRDALGQPTGDQSAALIAAAFFLAGGVVPLLYLLRSVLRRRSAESLDSATARFSATSPILERRTLAAHSHKGNSDLPFQRIYVDSAHIRP